MEDYTSLLSTLILKNLREEFSDKFLTGNLVETIETITTPQGIEIHIPAQIYDTEKWFKKKEKQYTGDGSYANELDEEGSSFILWWQTKYGYWKSKLLEPRNHENYIEYVIDKSILELKEMIGCPLTVNKR